MSMKARTILVSAIFVAACANHPNRSTTGALDTLNAAEKSYMDGDWQAARRGFETILRSDPSHAESHFRLGNIDLHERRFEAARQQYEAVLRFNPRQAKAHYNLALVHLIQAQAQFEYYIANTSTESVSVDLQRLLSAVNELVHAGNGPKNPLDALAERLSQDRRK